MSVGIERTVGDDIDDLVYDLWPHHNRTEKSALRLERLRRNAQVVSLVIGRFGLGHALIVACRKNLQVGKANRKVNNVWTNNTQSRPMWTYFFFIMLPSSVSLTSYPRDSISLRRASDFCQSLVARAS